MRITRHFVDVPGAAGLRRVHYRRCGSGPPLLMIHQSPRSSKEYEALLHDWGRSFMCIAPDTPGFGQSEPLPGTPEIEQFADALVELMDALGLGRVPAYGFHSGGIILVTALKRHPERFRALAIGGYAIWTEDERRLFSEAYLPPFVAQPYGEHLTWLWNRMLEQSWFFPWFDVRPETRLPGAHADVGRIAAAVEEMLDAGDAYRAGYGAVLRAPRYIPAVDAQAPPVLISAYAGDPLQAHIDRLGPLPRNWLATKVATPAEHHDDSLAFLRQYAAGNAPPVVEAADEGFVQVAAEGFDGLIHWRGDAVDPPGHGLSDDWAGEAPTDWAAWQAVFEGAGRPVGLPPLPVGDPALLYPDLTPDRFGSYLTSAWAIARARRLFAPWYEASAAAALPFAPDELAPDSLRRDHLTILRARSARALHIARQEETSVGD